MSLLDEILEGMEAQHRGILPPIGDKRKTEKIEAKDPVVQKKPKVAVVSQPITATPKKIDMNQFCAQKKAREKMGKQRAQQMVKKQKRLQSEANNVTPPSNYYSVLEPETSVSTISSNQTKPKTTLIRPELDPPPISARSKLSEELEEVPTSLVITAEECRIALEEIKQHKLVALDCEAVNMSRHGKLCLVQVATVDAAYLFDVIEGGEPLFEAGLKWLLETDSILKVIHDCRGDSDLLFHKHQVKLSHVFDTQVAFAIICRTTGKPTPLPVSLNTVIRRFAHGATNTLKDIVKEEMSTIEAYWEQRPLTKNMIEYAKNDVLYLPYIYAAMDAYFDTQSRKRVFTLSAEYVNQFRSMIERPNVFTFTKKEGEKENGPRPVPKYGFQDWDREVEFHLHPPLRRRNRREYD